MIFVDTYQRECQDARREGDLLAIDHFLEKKKT